MRLVELADKEHFDTVGYIRQMKSAADKLLHANSVVEKNDLVNEILKLAHQGRSIGQSLPTAHREKFFQDIGKVMNFVGLHSQQPRGDEPAKAGDPTMTPQGKSSEPPQWAEPGWKEQKIEKKKEDAPSDKWRMINLAYKDGAIGRMLLGVSENAGKYFLWGGKVGEKYKVGAPTDADAAKKDFSEHLKQGYTEASPGSYEEIKNGAKIGNAKAQSKWRMINLAYKDNGGTRLILGVSEDGNEYQIFRGKVGEKYAVSAPMSADAAKKFFSSSLDQGYTEASPGSYEAVKNGTKFPQSTRQSMSGLKMQ
jgi:hypothetical protein